MSAILHLAGSSEILQACLIVLATFVLEDATTIFSAMQVSAGHLAWWVALMALYAGILLGDLGLYGLGRLAASIPWAKRFRPGERLRRGREWVVRHVFRAVLVSRFLPGARLPTYTASGFFGADFGRFALAAAIAALGWTSLLFVISLRLGAFLQANLGAWSWAGAGGFAITIMVATHLFGRRGHDRAGRGSPTTTDPDRCRRRRR